MARILRIEVELMNDGVVGEEKEGRMNDGKEGL
jgi:hypothetical protein